jgi:anaerobic selenocysteine-containing dehydrogenase
MCLACPIKVRIKEGKVVEVRNEDNNFLQGRVCAKTIAGIWGRVYDPNRFLHPLKRVGERGEGRLERCSWEEVIDTVAKQLKEYIEAGHPEFFEIWWGCPVQTDHEDFLAYWSRVVGSMISYMHGQVCFGDRVVESLVSYGGNHSYLHLDSADLPNTKYAILAGINYPGTCAARGGVVQFKAARERGCKFVMIDPKLADSSAILDEWIPIKPGMDGIFALGVANLLIKEKLYDEAFLLNVTNAPQLIKIENGQALKDEDGHYMVWDETNETVKPLPEAGESNRISLGLGKIFSVKVNDEIIECQTAFQMLAETVAQYTPELVIEICELPFSVEWLKGIAENLGINKPAVIFYPGFTSGRYPNWFQVLRAYSAVNFLLGNFEQPGGWYINKHSLDLGIHTSRVWPEDPSELPDPDYLVSPFNGSIWDAGPIERGDFNPGVRALPWFHIDAIMEGKLRTLLSTAENSAYTQLNLGRVWEALKKLDLIIVSDQVPKDFVDLADFVIPEASWLERNMLYEQTMLGVEGKEHVTVFMRGALIPPRGESKTLHWFMLEVAKKLGGSIWEKFKDLDLEYGWFDDILKNAGLEIRAKNLIEEGPLIQSYPMEYDISAKQILTRSSRFEIYSNELAEECYFNPNSPWFGDEHVYPIPINNRIVGPKEHDEFYLICGKASWHQKNATQNNRYLMDEGLEGGNPLTSIYINTERAKNLGIENGDYVEIEAVGPTKKEDPIVTNEVIGVRGKARVKTTQGIHPSAAFVFFGVGHKSKLMLARAREGIATGWFVPDNIGPYAGQMGKGYAIITVRKI